ncbi:DUF2628 domain-containing protein [Methylocapsa sp. S129]|uniref:DUF2628 domain-containing protein n=1 Tax=Methylocapsa sp. S129 TaxID=1641869 RepID=UPI00131D9CC9|nr:DUF2628 domain-containing protein [Methylocapsa sp. S129]
MAIYSVHIPVGGADPAAVAERAAFLREGFSRPAFLFGPFWLLARGLWRPLGVWCLAAVLVGFAISYGLLRDSAATWLYLVSCVFLGLEGKSFVGAAMERRGLGLVDIVAGPDLIAAERAFFSRWLAIDGAPVATPAAARAHAPVADAAHVIGLFPEAGG